MDVKQYIDRDEYERRVNKCVKLTNREEQEWVKDECIRQAHCMPAADVETVVRCKNCTKWEPYENTSGAGYCHNRNFCFRYGANMEREFTPITMPDDFCSFGERRKKDEL